MEFNDYIFLVVWFIGGFIGGISGMGASMIAVPVLLAILEPDVLVPVSCIISAVICLYLSWVYHKTCITSVLKRLLIGSIPGSVIGVYVLVIIRAEYIEILAGLALLYFVYLQYMHDRAADVVQREEVPMKSYFVGFCTGTLNSAISFGGPLVAAYALYLGWAQAQFMGTVSVFGFLISVMVCIFQAMAGLFTTEVLTLGATGSVACILGAACATPVVKYIPLKVFKRILLILLICSAVMCIERAFETL